MNKADEIARDASHSSLLSAACESTSNTYLASLMGSGALPRDLADAAHFVCALHGRHPGVIGQAHARVVPAPAWLDAAADAFRAERSYLARVVAAAGPLPSTPGQAESEAAVAGQRHAIETLACSDRIGCALGAAAALVLDWPVIRAMLDVAARRFGIEPVASTLPADAVSHADFGVHERAARFAAQQLHAQHRGLWRLLAARAAARG